MYIYIDTYDFCMHVYAIWAISPKLLRSRRIQVFLLLHIYIIKLFDVESYLNHQSGLLEVFFQKMYV